MAASTSASSESPTTVAVVHPTVADLIAHPRVKLPLGSGDEVDVVTNALDIFEHSLAVRPRY